MKPGFRKWSLGQSVEGQFSFFLPWLLSASCLPCSELFLLCHTPLPHHPAWEPGDSGLKPYKLWGKNKYFLLKVVNHGCVCWMRHGKQVCSAEKEAKRGETREKEDFKRHQGQWTNWHTEQLGVMTRNLKTNLLWSLPGPLKVALHGLMSPSSTERWSKSVTVPLVFL